MTQAYEDIALGLRTELGTHTFTAEEIIAFAQAYDPQRFHLSQEAAEQTHFGRLCASGWHTAVVFMRLSVAQQQAEAAARGEDAFRHRGPSPGFQDLVWRRPVFVGDTLRYVSVVTDKRLLTSRPDWGLVTSRHEGWNQENALAFAVTGHVFVRRRLP